MIKKICLIAVCISSYAYNTHTIENKHTVYNKSDKPIQVHMRFHGESKIACQKKRKDNLQPGESFTHKSGACQLKKLVIKQWGPDAKTTVNVKNASETTYRRAFGGLLSDKTEVVARGSTAWDYEGPGQIKPRPGSKIEVYTK